MKISNQKENIKKNMTKLLGKTKQNIKKKHASARLKSFFKK